MGRRRGAEMVARESTIMIRAPEPGELLDRYRIEKLIARGGMASIFRATDTRTNAPVAIKVPNPDMEADVLFFDRFKREAEIGRKLDHPGVVKVLPEDDASRIYMAMEWVDGVPLRDILDEKKNFSPDRAVRIALALCDTLEYIHTQGIVHRDLKPDNIMLDADDRIKLIDFGIAGDTRARRLTYAKITKAMGTPDYVSPEQVKGKRGDARSDVYSLGVILYEMLAGDVPFRSANPLTSMNMRLLADPASPREANRNISPQLEEIIFRALEREPIHRYGSAREFAWDLQHPEEVGVSDRKISRQARNVMSQKPRSFRWSYVAYAMLPLLLLGLMLIIAHVQ